MSEREQNQPSGRPGRVLRCDEWENLIADALDGTLNAADAAAFGRHQGECAVCAQMLKEAQQGKAWMEYLAAEPEVPADLFKKILARTSGYSAAGEERGVTSGVPPAVRAVPARSVWHRTLPVVRQVARQAFEPRLMMTAAMAFFSIALTLNLTGIKLTEVRAADLRPARLRATLTRQYYATNEQVTKYYENLRLVYEMEARVRELRRSTEAEPSPRPAPSETPKQPPRDGSPSSTAPVPQGKRTPFDGDTAQPAMVATSLDRSGKSKKVKREVFRALWSTTEDQAERSLV
jgi:hypothetical protein